MLDVIDIIKIIITVASIVTLFLFRKSIIKVINGLVANGETKQRTKDQIIADVNKKLNYLTGKR